MEFKDELKRFRKENKITQVELAKKLGIDFTTVNRFENGHFNPSYDVLNKFETLKNKGCDNTIRLPTLPTVSESDDVFTDISILIEKSENIAYQSVNILLIQRNWMIGKRIHDEELKKSRSENYGLEIIKNLSIKLTGKYGSGFKSRNLYSFVDFYKTYPNILQTLSAESCLSWSHYLVLLQIDDKDARIWYENETNNEAWSVRTLQRNVSSQYYYRILKSQKINLVKKAMLSKTKELEDDKKLDFIKNPTILEFLNLPENNDYIEKDLENCLIENLKKFLMESGKGYAFVAS